MAVLNPSNAALLRQDHGLYREIDIVEGLAASLPDGFEVFHGMELHAVRSGRDHYGEIDIVVMAPSGALLLMEVKAGEVSVSEGRIYKRYGAELCDVDQQCRVQRGSLLGRLQDAQLDTGLLSCLVLPDWRLTDEHAVSFPRERIVDADRFPRLTTLVREWLAGAKGCGRRDALRQFLRNQFRVTADLSAARDQLQRTVRLLSDGLATWVPRIGAPSGAIRIQATAGSGKTQLALGLLEAAVAAGQRAAYVCYNRTLADHVRELAPARAEVVNFHLLAVEHLRRVAGEPDFSSLQVLDQAAVRYASDSDGFVPRWDVLIIDEGQDFDPDWIACLCRQLRPDGKLYLMEDDDQRLYERAGFDIADAVTVQSRDNFRSPRLVCDVINALALAHSPIVSHSTYRGMLPGLHLYATTSELTEQLARVVASLLERGFALNDMVILSNRGRAASALTGLAQIGPWRTRQFTGAYDRSGNPLWTEGELTVESVYRFKGQSAPAVILAEVDFDGLSPQDRKKLFVGMTRAQMAVEMVLTASAERTLLALFQERESE